MEVKGLWSQGIATRGFLLLYGKEKRNKVPTGYISYERQYPELLAEHSFSIPTMQSCIQHQPQTAYPDFCYAHFSPEDEIGI